MNQADHSGVKASLKGIANREPHEGPRQSRVRSEYLGLAFVCMAQGVPRRGQPPGRVGAHYWSAINRVGRAGACLRAGKTAGN